MNATRRLIVVIGVVVVAAVGFVIAKATEDSSRPTVAESLSAPAPAPAGGATGARGTGTVPARRAAPAIPRIVVRGLEPVGGVKQLVFRKGDTIRFAVVSDQPEEIHLHGYDVAEDVAPGREVTFAVPAEIEGIFEVELEHAGVQIASVAVEP
ncbi:hypothetical protein [Conexibacter arvalis]|uniref:EfeO-type cupredoxin-like domain-containing protein n=1 Tax=Conexibacter arvalis TaxID=912552 RepID=A0A840IKA9_9ACTN|nr:hypothetical protein [Conexibacter arvalis]MBB4665159.1 hypothetical protein [Conexibacter arvalis]